ncbi:PucR family transcriptional regulator [Natribacillus halophilus]|nr:PucR family transcriptional regulator [Natribacillus halophilus]
MEVNVQDLMKIGGLRNCKVIAGENGLNNEVNHVTIMEVPDIVQWLKGKELLLTSLYAVKDDLQAQIDLIRELSSLGTSAVAIKPHRFVDQIDQNLLNEANRYNLPIIEIPEHISYLDIVSPVSEEIFSNKEILQEDLEQANQLLNEAAISAQGFEEFITIISQLTKNKITIESLVPQITTPEFNLTFKSLDTKQRQELEHVKHPVRMTRVMEKGEAQCVVAPIIIDAQVAGYLTSWGINTQHMKMDLAILEKASTLLALEFLKIKVKFDVEQQYKNEFLRDILLNEKMDEYDLVERGKLYRFSLDSRYVCIALHFVNNGQFSFLDAVNRVDNYLKSKYKHALVGHISNFILVLIPTKDISEIEFEKQMHSLSRYLHKDDKTKEHLLAMGIGRHYPGVKGMQNSYYEAKKAGLLATDIRDSFSILYYEDLGIYRLFDQIRDGVEMKQFYQDTIGKLISSDQENQVQLLETLDAYFAQDEKLQETANNLYIHVNTLKYRLNKIEKITGYNLKATEEKIMLALGLKISRYLKINQNI